MNQANVEASVIESLRQGIPPQRGVDLYSVGYEKFIGGIERFHFSGIKDRGIIRFVSGSWGSGKTHLFRLLRDVAFRNYCLVSNVELDVNDAPLNKFERVFYSIVRNVATPSYYAESDIYEIAPFSRVVRESLVYLGTGERIASEDIPYDCYSKASEALMADRSIDIDFKKMVRKYWETFLPEAADPSIQQQERDEILQWFSGEGTVGQYRKRFGVNKVVNKENAKLMLQSLAGFVRLSGYQGLVILFDEAEQAYSIMRKAALKAAHNNLLSLINNVESLSGLLLIYATTPDFYSDPNHGIRIYGALAGRIGRPEPHAPRALDIVWNIDEIETELPTYQIAAKKIREIYCTAYVVEKSELPNEQQIELFVAKLDENHSSVSPIAFWRLMVTALITHFDDHLEGDVRPTEEVYDDVMDRLREIP